MSKAHNCSSNEIQLHPKLQPSIVKIEVRDEDNDDHGIDVETSSCLSPTTSKIEISPKHMKLWFNMAVSDNGSYAKLLWSLVNWSMETFPLLATVILVLIDQENPSSSRDIRWTLLLHLTCCCIRLILAISNPLSNSALESRNAGFQIQKFYFYTFLANVFMILKPYRYISGFLYRSNRRKSVKDQLRLRRPLTREEIQSVISINKRNVTDHSYNITEVFVQTIPMALLQLYIIFQNNRSFKICSRADASRLFMFIFCIFSSAKSASDYTWHYNNYLKSLHFLYFFDTRHPIHLQSQNQLGYAFNLLCNVFLLVHRFYCISFFLAVSKILTGIYLTSLFIVQWIMLRLFPSLRIPFENPTVGTPTLFSEIIDRWINVFTNHMTKFTCLTVKSFKICKLWKLRLPLSILQIVPFALSMTAVFVVSYTSGSAWEHYELLKSVKRPVGNVSFDSGDGDVDRQVDDTVLIVPCTNFTLESESTFVNAIGHFMFQTHQKASNRFLSFKDIFGVIHFLPFSMYFYLCCSITYSYYLAWFNLNDPMFPVQAAHEFWHFLITNFTQDKQTKTTDTDIKKRQHSLRKLMILTVIEDTQFYQMYHRRCRSNCNWFRTFNSCDAKSQESYWDSVALDLVQNMTESGPILESKLIEVSQLDHPLHQDFETLLGFLIQSEGDRGTIEVEVDKKLFLLFYARFDNKMRGITSFRIKCIFTMLFVPVTKLRL